MCPFPSPCPPPFTTQAAPLKAPLDAPLAGDEDKHDWALCKPATLPAPTVIFTCTQKGACDSVHFPAEMSEIQEGQTFGAGICTTYHVRPSEPVLCSTLHGLRTRHCPGPCCACISSSQRLLSGCCRHPHFTHKEMGAQRGPPRQPMAEQGYEPRPAGPRVHAAATTLLPLGDPHLAGPSSLWSPAPNSVHPQAGG